MDQAMRLRELALRMPPIIKRPLASNLRTVAVTSGKGGVGKTNIVVNLALILAAQGQRVAVFDADLGLANVDVLLGMAPKFSFYDVIKGEKTLEEIILEGPRGIKIVPGGTGLHEMANLDNHQREQIVQSFTYFDRNTDFLLIDTAAGISRNVLGFLNAADEVIIVATPEPTSIADAYGLIKVMARLKLQRRLYLIVNRVDTIREAQNTVHKLEMVCTKFLSLKPEYLGYIRDDRHVTKAVKQQQPWSLSYPNAAAVEDLGRIGCALLDVEPPAAKGMGVFLNRLIRIFR